MMRPNGVEKQVRPSGWKPGANTIAYFPFTEDALDHSGNGVVLSGSNYLAKATQGYSFILSQGNTGQFLSVGFSNTNVKFISMWYKVLSTSGNAAIGGLNKYGAVQYYTSHSQNSLNNKITIFINSSYNTVTETGMTFNEWHYISFGYDGSKVVISKDGVLSTLYNGTGYDLGNEIVFCGIGNNGNVSYLLSDCICESVARTAEEIQDYFNQTKGNYGIS